MSDDEILEFFAKIIKLELGIVYNNENFYQLRPRLEDLASRVGLTNLNALYRLCSEQMDQKTKQLLLDFATNNETSFFRDQNIFDCLNSYIFPKITHQGSNINIWSAACSSGQEAISVCITLLEYQEKNNFQFSFKIIASDISQHILNKAKAGIYSDLEVQRGLTSIHLKKYFQPIDSNKWQVNRNIYDHISYQNINLKEALPFTNSFDLILCRNALIYQEDAQKKIILSRISNKLKENGFLILGTGENVHASQSSCVQVNLGNAVVFKKTA